LVKKAKKLILPSRDPNEFNMKIVTSDKCKSCMLCERGIKYVEKMSQPGVIAFGVPCILTKGKAFK
jgi:hypothetical protein